METDEPVEVLETEAETEESPPADGFVNEGDDKKYYKGGQLLKSTWVTDENGTYYYTDQNGSVCVGKYIINDVTYFFNDDGSLYEGWLSNAGRWYYFTENGALTGYQNITEDDREEEYYFDEAGHLVEDAVTPDGRIANEDGILQNDDSETFDSLPGFDIKSNEEIVPGALSGISISGEPVEFYMLSIAGETSGGRIVMGDRGRAYGLCQYDYRYDLVDFIKWAYAKHPDLWREFSQYLSYKTGDTELIRNQGILNAFLKARERNYEAAISDELEYMRILYWDSIKAQMDAAGFALSDRHIAVSAALFSVSVNCGKHADIFIENLSPDMSDAAMICGIYKLRNTVFAEMKVGRYKKGTTPRYRISEPQMALDLLHGYTTIDSAKNYGAGVQWRGNIFSSAVTTSAIEGVSPEWTVFDETSAVQEETAESVIESDSEKEDIDESDVAIETEQESAASVLPSDEGYLPDIELESDSAIIVLE